MSMIRVLTEWFGSSFEKWPVLRVCVRTFYACMRLAIPTNPRLIAFVSHPDDCADNAYALFEQVMKSPQAREFCLVWLATDLETATKTLTRDYPHLDPAHVKIVRKNTLHGLFWFLRSRYVFFTHGVYWFVSSGRHQTIVNLWHGMPIKRVGALDAKWISQPLVAHYSLATSDFFAALMARALSMPRDRVLVTGLPRNEWLFRSDPRHALVRDGHSRLVVWLPTYRLWDDGRRTLRDAKADFLDPITAESLTSFDRMLDGVGALLILKFHPGDARNAESWPMHKNIRVYTHQVFREENLNLYKLLGSSDALITDYSSIAIDYLLLRKPIGFFAPDIDAYLRGFMPGVWDRLAAVCPQLKTIEELAEFVRKPSPPPPVTREIEDLHRHDLREPSAAILRAVGLGVLLPKPDRREALPAGKEIGVEETSASG